MNPKSVSLPTETLDALIEALDPSASYTDSDSIFWSIHEISDYEVKKTYLRLDGARVFELQVSAGMGHEHDESVVYDNNQCTATLVHAEKWQVTKAHCKH